jgi:hypothetical protein
MVVDASLLVGDDELPFCDDELPFVELLDP